MKELKLNNADMAKMRQEIDRWRAEALIDDKLAETLLSRYLSGAGGSGYITAILMMGAVLVGIGILLFVAANWAGMSTVLKLAIIIGSMLAFGVSGYRCGFEPGNRPRLGAALMLVSSIIYGAGIWLITQTYNIDIDVQQGILLWAAGVGAAALATRSSVQSLLFCVLAACWVPSELSIWQWPTGDPMFVIARVLTAFGISAGLAYFTRSKAAFALSAAASTLSLAFIGGVAPVEFVLLPWAVTLFCGYLLLKNVWTPGASSFMYSGTGGMVLGLLILTFSHGDVHIPVTMQFALLPILALVAAASAALKRKEYQLEALAACQVMVIPIIMLSLDLKPLYVLGINALLLAILVGLVWTGQNRLKQPGLINLAIAAFVIEVICRYFDFFFTMMDRSVVFTIGGILLLAAGTAAERGRRKLLEGIR